MSIAINQYFYCVKKTNFLNVGPIFKKVYSCFLQEFGSAGGEQKH